MVRSYVKILNDSKVNAMKIYKEMITMSILNVDMKLCQFKTLFHSFYTLEFRYLIVTLFK